MRKKGTKNKKYSPKFKLSVILDKRENNLAYIETVRKYSLGKIESGGARQMLQRWERKYLEEGYEGLMKDYLKRQRLYYILTKVGNTK